MGVQAACISHCSPSHRLPLPSSHCIIQNGSRSSTGMALLVVPSQCSAWMSVGRGSSKALLGPCRAWLGCVPAQPPGSSTCSIPLAAGSPTVLPAAPPSLSTCQPWAGHTGTLGAQHPWSFVLPAPSPKLLYSRANSIVVSPRCASAFLLSLQTGTICHQAPGDTASTPG